MQIGELLVKKKKSKGQQGLSSGVVSLGEGGRLGALLSGLTTIDVTATSLPWECWPGLAQVGALRG